MGPAPSGKDAGHGRAASHPIYPAHPKKLATSWKMVSTKSSVQTALQHPLGPTAPLPSVFKPLSSPGKKA